MISRRKEMPRSVTASESSSGNMIAVSYLRLVSGRMNKETAVNSAKLPSSPGVNSRAKISTLAALIAWAAMDPPLRTRTFEVKVPASGRMLASSAQDDANHRIRGLQSCPLIAGRSGDPHHGVKSVHVRVAPVKLRAHAKVRREF